MSVSVPAIYDDLFNFNGSVLQSIFDCFFPVSHFDFLQDPATHYKLSSTTQYGTAWHTFVESIDPLRVYRTLRSLSTPDVLRTGQRLLRFQRALQGALLAAADLGTALRASTDYVVPMWESSLSATNPRELVESVRTKSVYFTPHSADFPIVIDTGASMSITPCRDDFKGKLDPAPITELHGLNSTSKVCGIGTVCWTVKDIFGVVRTIKTKAYYVPDASIRLFSPQVYFQSNGSGCLLAHHQRAFLTVQDDTTLEFPYSGGSNLPIMLSTNTQSTVGLTYEDLETLTSGYTVNSYLSVADTVNQNITPTQKELLKWHWRLGHLHFSWLQRLCATPRDTDRTDLPVLPSAHSKLSTCPPPLCAACQLAKQTRRGSSSSIEIGRPEREMLLRRDNITPGSLVSADQYVSAVPGRRGHTKGREAPADQFRGGTIFVDHATSYVFLRHQVSLRAGDTVTTKHAFEREAATMGVPVKGYRADNVPFGSWFP